MMESAEQMPRFTQTGSGGKRMAKMPRNRSVEHIMMIGCGINLEERFEVVLLIGRFGREEINR